MSLEKKSKMLNLELVSYYYVMDIRMDLECNLAHLFDNFTWEILDPHQMQSIL